MTTAKKEPEALWLLGRLVRDAYTTVDDQLGLLKRKLAFINTFDPAWVGITDFDSVVTDGWLGWDMVPHTKQAVEEGTFAVLAVIHGVKAMENTSGGEIARVDSKLSPQVASLKEIAGGMARAIDVAIEGKSTNQDKLNAQIALLSNVRSALVSVLRLASWKWEDGFQPNELDLVD